MTKARGRVQTLDLLQVSGLDSRIWQKEGSSTDNLGVVYSLAGEVVKASGIQPLVEWFVPQRMANVIGPTFDPGISTPFYTEHLGTQAKLMSVGSFDMNGAVEILVEYGGVLSVVRGSQVEVLQTGRHRASRPSEGTQFLQVGGAVIIVNGVDQNMKWDGLHLTPLGIQVVPSPPELPANSQGTNPGKTQWNFSGTTAPGYAGTTITKPSGALTGTYQYKLPYVNNQGTESEPSAPSNKITDQHMQPGSGQTTTMFVKIAGLGQAVSADRHDIVKRRLYRNGVDSIEYYLLAELPGIRSDYYLDSSDNFYTSSVSIPSAGTRLPPPIASMLMQFRGRTYYAGNPSSPRSLYYSAPNGLKEEVAQPSNIILVNSQDGADEITAMTTVSDYGLVFTKRSVHMLTEDRTGKPNLTPVSQTIGAAGKRAICAFEDKVYFFSREGIFVFDGGSPKPLSKEVSSMVEQLPKAMMKDVVAFSDPAGRRVCFSVCAGPKTGNNEVWAIHVDTGAISRLPFIVYDAMPYKNETLVAYGFNSFGNVNEHLGSPGGTFFYETVQKKAFVQTELGMWGCQHSVHGNKPIEAFFETRWMIGNNPESDKTFYRVDVFYVQTSDKPLKLSWYTDWERPVVGQEHFTTCAPEALTWDGLEEPLDPTTTPLQTRAWDNLYPEEIKTPKGWDEQRVRSVRINLGTSRGRDDESGDGLTAKSIKFRFGDLVSYPVVDPVLSREEEAEVEAEAELAAAAGGSGLTASRPPSSGSGKIDTPFRIVGLVVHYSDHGVRGEGTDRPKDR